MTEMVYGTAPVRVEDPILPRWWRTIDKMTLTSVLLLMAVGILLGMAASPPLAQRNGVEPFYYVERQVLFGGLGIIAMLLISMASPERIRRLATIGFLLTLTSLILLPFFGTDFGKGAVRWYSFGVGSIQPSEFLKPMLAVFAAWLMAASSDVGGPPGRAMSFGVTLLVVGLLVIQPDFGQAALVAAGWMVMYFVAGAPILLLVGLAVLALAGGYVAYQNSEHFARRIDGFLAEDVDPRTQMGYAQNAISEGGFFGTGLGEGRVKWSLPDAHTDFIIAVAAEEYGLVLVVFIIGLFATILLRSLFRLMRERDMFIRLAGTGIVTIFCLQAMINMGVAVRLLPAKGMTLPMISYGGSSLLATGIAIGMLLALTRQRPQGEMGDILARRG
ncbi:MAG: cell division protein FtsW [Roseibaca calidilacus]|uniref:Probable peptidoglycan glycosyltransferase FtsW n=1 Tax=Roseibaca calidilacus TaxID=1666912 RepID=A0A0P7WEM4_9RHOB|nr:putative peptidoglycan glycosyltransferase FtsW [Roseibaca calidilacus]KPP92498.1 MAG: cell division protein FtsW [Roseibaca calidilacus]CUX79795.1 cell division protein FtsW [Roseibaca calidilacus]